MGNPGDESSTSAPSSLSTTVSNRVSALVYQCVITLYSRKVPKDLTGTTPMESCMCGCDGGACIPQREYHRKRTDPISRDQLQEMILFKVNGKCGYSLIDALKGYYTGLDGRDDRMFVDFKSSISMRLEVRLTHRPDSVVVSNPVRSGCRTKNGQARSVPVSRASLRGYLCTSRRFER